MPVCVMRKGCVGYLGTGLGPGGDKEEMQSCSGGTGIPTPEKLSRGVDVGVSLSRIPVRSESERVTRNAGGPPIL